MKKRSFEYLCDDIENVENYEAAKKDNFRGWNCHHRLQTHNSDGERRLVDITAEELIALDMYYHRPANELIFLTASKHHSLHSKGKHHSEETKKKMSEADRGRVISNETKMKMSKSMKGKNTWMKGRHLSDETRKKIGEASKGRRHSEEAKNRISEFQKGKRKGKHWKLVDGKRVWY